IAAIVERLCVIGLLCQRAVEILERLRRTFEPDQDVGFGGERFGRMGMGRQRVPPGSGAAPEAGAPENSPARGPGFPHRAARPRPAFRFYESLWPAGRGIGDRPFTYFGFRFGGKSKHALAGRNGPASLAF